MNIVKLEMYVRNVPSAQYKNILHYQAAAAAD